MRLPRDVSGDDLARALRIFGYQVTRQTGSHMRLTTERSGEHHITVPKHDPLRIGTLASIVDDIAGHLDMDRDALIRQLFGSKS